MNKELRNIVPWRGAKMAKSPIQMSWIAKKENEGKQEVPFNYAVVPIFCMSCMSLGRDAGGGRVGLAHSLIPLPFPRKVSFAAVFPESSTSQRKKGPQRREKRLLSSASSSTTTPNSNTKYSQRTISSSGSRVHVLSIPSAWSSSWLLPVVDFFTFSRHPNNVYPLFQHGSMQLSSPSLVQPQWFVRVTRCWIIFTHKFFKNYFYYSSTTTIISQRSLDMDRE